MGMDLHQLLRSLCFNADWKYAVFWKPQHRARMVLTLEDAYYDNHEYYWPMEKQYSGKTLAQLHGGNFSNDLLGLAVTKMSYRVYSLGEGIVGQVAVTGEYQWISANDHVINSSSSSEFSDGWQCQFYAGIKTVVVIGIIPLGVIQLGSLHNVMENMDVVSYIRNLFLPLQDYSIIQIPNPMHSSMRSSMSASDIPIKNLGLENFPDRFQVMEKGGNIETPGFCSPFPSPKVKYMPSGFDGSDVGWHDKYGELYGDDTSNLLQSTSNMMQLDNQKYVNFSLLKEKKCRWENNGHNDMGMLPEKNQSSLLDNITFDNSNLSELISLPEKVVIDPTCSSEAILAVNSENSQCGLGTNLKEIMYCPGNSAANSRNSVKKFECEAKASNRTTSCSSLNFPAGCELREALGPAFVRRWNYFDSEGKETQNAELPEMADGSSTSQLTFESCSSNLLEAIVANICHNINDIKSEISSSTSIQSPLTSGKTPEGCSHNNLHMLDSESCSLDKRSLSKENTQCCLSSSGFGDLTSLKGFSSTCTGTCREKCERTIGPSKNTKKRSRPGESCRPRPRDRQLIQDRIKELRELIPNVSKCSIDSLLERTIKHMLLLQSITKYADSLKSCIGSKIKLQVRKTDSQGSSSCEQGSSWPMEVGGHLKVHSIEGENLDKNGQMFVEMLCEDCSHVLEIAQAIRSMGLTILKGATKAHNEKTWMCFLVEESLDMILNAPCRKNLIGQSNGSEHRLDILWTLVQMLQCKSAPQES